MSPAAPIAIVILLLFVGFIVRLNIWYAKTRAGMHPDERRRHDEEMHIPGDW